jgi:hypothetical protein
MEINYIQKLPEDVIINHIIPYTYQVQPRRLLSDIHSFVNDYTLVESIYMTQFNQHILLHDLLQFCCINLYPSYGMENLFDGILRRHCSISGKSEEYLINMVRLNFHRNVELQTERKIKFIWGLLTRQERTQFINKYLLD